MGLGPNGSPLQALLGAVQQAGPYTSCTHLTDFSVRTIAVETDRIGQSGQEGLALAAHASHGLTARQHLLQYQRFECAVRAESSPYSCRCLCGQVGRTVADRHYGPISPPSRARRKAEGVDQIAQRNKRRGVVHHADKVVLAATLLLLLLPKLEKHKIEKPRVVHGVVKGSGV